MAKKRKHVRAVREIVALLRPHVPGEGWRLTGGALLGVLVVALHVLRPWPIKWILDFVSGVEIPPFVQAAFGEVPITGVVALSAVFVAVSLAAAGAEYWQILVLNGAGNRILFRFRAALFVHVLRQPLAYHESREVGELLTRIVYDTSRLRRGVNGMLIRIVQTLALFVATIVVLLWIHPALGLVLAAGGTAALFAMRVRGRRIAGAARKQRRKEGRLAALVANELMAIRELQTFGVRQSAVTERFEDRNRKSLRQEQKVRRLAAGLSLRVDVLLAISVAIAMAFGAAAAVRGALTPGDLVLFFSYALALRAPFADFAYQTARLGRTYACADRLEKIARREPAIADAPAAVPAPAFSGSIAFEDVAVKGPAKTRIGRKWTLDGLTLAVRAGERVAVVGPNGSGKSTLLRVILRLVDPQRGRLLLDGRDVREFTVESVRAQISVVFQDSVLSGLTVRDNVLLGLPEADEAQLAAAVAAAAATRLIERLPEGYDTPVRRGGRLFSGGERQRLALARAILRGGRVWLLDEPTAGLDPTGVESLAESLFAAAHGRTMIWVTHELELLKRFDRVVELDAGRVVFHGTPAEYAMRAGASPGSAPRRAVS